MKELKKTKQNVSHPGRAEDNAFCGAGEDNQLTRSQAYTRYREAAEQWNQCNQIRLKTGYSISNSWTEEGGILLTLTPRQSC